VRELLEVLRELESLQAARAAERAKDSDKLMLRSILCGMRTATGQAAPERYWQLATQLHDVIHAVARHEITREIVKQVWKDLAVSNFWAPPHLAVDSLWEHELLVDSISVGDADGAHRAMFEHLSVVIPGAGT
jgi:DNA-binding FadR family transcriptional regulator